MRKQDNTSTEDKWTQPTNQYITTWGLRALYVK